MEMLKSDILSQSRVPPDILSLLSFMFFSVWVRDSKFIRSKSYSYIQLFIQLNHSHSLESLHCCPWVSQLVMGFPKRALADPGSHWVGVGVVGHNYHRELYKPLEQLKRTEELTPPPSRHNRGFWRSTPGTFAKFYF